MGNYNVRTLINYLATILPSTFIISYSAITNKLTFTNTSTFTINASTSTINKIIGLSLTDLTGALSYETPGHGNNVFGHPLNFRLIFSIQ